MERGGGVEEAKRKGGVDGGQERWVDGGQEAGVGGQAADSRQGGKQKKVK